MRKVVSTDSEASTSSTGKRATLAARLQRIEGGFQFLFPSTFPCQHSNKALSKLGSLDWTEFLPSVKLWMKSSRTGDEFLNLVSRYLVLSRTHLVVFGFKSCVKGFVCICLYLFVLYSKPGVQVFGSLLDTSLFKKNELSLNVRHARSFGQNKASCQISSS